MDFTKQKTDTLLSLVHIIRKLDKQALHFFPNAHTTLKTRMAIMVQTFPNNSGSNVIYDPKKRK